MSGTCGSISEGDGESHISVTILFKEEGCRVIVWQ